MGTFRVLVHGRGLVVRRFWFWRQRLGFYTTCYVDADDAAVAGARAIEFLRSESKLILAALEAPEMTVEELEEITSFDKLPHPRTGFVFYPAAGADRPRPVA